MSFISNIRTTFVLLLLAVISLGASAQFTGGEKSFGPSIGYMGKNDGVTIALQYRCPVGKYIRLAPEVSTTFRNHDMDAFGVAVNVQAPIGLGASKVAVYPLVGLQYMSWTHHWYLEAKDTTDHVNRFGANIGAGAEMRISQSLKLALEAKGILLRDYTSFAASVGIYYIF